MTVGILYIATGKYTVFWKDFYTTAKEYLFPEIHKQFFVFTDLPVIYGEEEDPDIIKIHIQHREWPYNTLLRFEIFAQHQKLFKDCSFLLFYNANTIFTERIEPEEILPGKHDNYLVALSNNDIFDIPPDQFTYDRNPESLAYIPYGTGTRYYRGCFNGGRTPEFLKLIETCRANTEKDLQSGVIALWHDESHLNKYLLDKKIKIVGTEYGKAEEWKKPQKAKVIYIDKNRWFGTKEMRKFKSASPPKYSLGRFIKKLIQKISS